MPSLRIRPARLRTGSVHDVHLDVDLPFPLTRGGRVWLFCDIRQEAAPADVAVVDPHQAEITSRGVRTLDLYPDAPEFLWMARIDACAKTASSELRIHLRNWQAPRRPISPFRFWLLVDPGGEWDFVPTGYKTYHHFIDTASGGRADLRTLRAGLRTGQMEVVGRYPTPPRHLRRAPRGGWDRPFWGDLHGMALNQRPLDDFYAYARNVSHLDFCAAVLFSYNTCVEDVWAQVVDAARRNTRRGRFAGLAAFECGTPPDDSHRVVYFPDPVGVPPIFCESRPPALDSALHSRFHPATIFCRDVADLFRVVDSYGGFLGGHFHTLTYQNEILAEIWQKQEFTPRYQEAKPSVNEEENIYELLRSGHRLGITASSDTHDSMPGNPDPEPGCPRPAGLTGVWADALQPRSICDALVARRCFATTGARMIMHLEYGDSGMGEVCGYSPSRRIHITIRGTARLERVEVLEDGVPAQIWLAHNRDFDYSWAPRRGNETHWYVVRAVQIDGHRGWTSPIWLTP